MPCRGAWQGEEDPSRAGIPLSASCQAPELPTHHYFPSPSLVPWATALSAFAYSRPRVDFELLTLHFPLLSVCQSFLDEIAEPD